MLLRNFWVCRCRPNQGTRSMECEGIPREANEPSIRSLLLPRETGGAGTGDEQSYESIVPMKVENRRAPARGGHGIHWREGMNRLLFSKQCHRHETQNSRMHVKWT